MGGISDFSGTTKNKTEQTDAGTDTYEKAGKCNAEHELIRMRIVAAMERFYLNPCQEKMERVCDEFVNAVVSHVGLYVPMWKDNDTMPFQLMVLDNYGLVYTAYTDMEELMKCPAETSAMIPIEEMFERVLSSERIAGMLINTFRKPECGLLTFLRRDNIKRIMFYAKDPAAQLVWHVQQNLSRKL